MLKWGRMQHMKKLAITFACFLVVMFTMVGCNVDLPEQSVEPETPVIKTGAIKNVILMIGDGFGPNHLRNAKKYFGIDKFAFEDDYICDVTTYSNDNAITDSAAAASALATGQKFNNGEVGRHQFQDVKNIMEYAQENKMKTGVITSDTLHGATPAGFSAHTDSRGDVTGIADDQIKKSKIDLFVGAQAKEYDDFIYVMKNGYHHEINNVAVFDNLNKSEKYLTMFPNLKPERNHELSNPGENWVDFPALIKKSLQYLDNENGFCCMIENANIDKYSHGNDFVSTMYEVLYFAKMIEAVYEFVEGRDDTVVLITADHETGGLKLAGEADALDNTLFTTGDHTATDVHLWMNLPATSTTGNYKAKIDNTDIFKICHKIVTSGEFDTALITELPQAA